ncbi:MAG: thioredoxin-disulfide reductase [Candidatus Komeilibacteria bacterium]
MTDNKYDIIIAGSGPAGWTAAIYATRAEFKTLVVSGREMGGQLMTTTDVENFPGFPEGIQGPELMTKMQEQARRFGAEIIAKDVSKIVKKGEKDFIVKVDDDEYRARAVIISTGASARWLNLPSETKLRGKGVSACATCDGFFFKDKIVAVVGGGDAAMEEATFLTKFAKQVHVLARADEGKLRASKIMQERAFQNNKIKFYYNTEVQEVLGDEKVRGLKVINNKTQAVSQLDIDGLFVAIGHKPNTDFIKGLVGVDRKGYVVLQENTQSSVPGIFVAGDVADHRYRQAITAAGTGCQAALDAQHYLTE